MFPMTNKQEKFRFCDRFFSLSLFLLWRGKKVTYSCTPPEYAQNPEKRGA